MQIDKNPPIVNAINSIRFKIGNNGYATLDSRWKAENLACPFNRLYMIESGTGSLCSGDQQLQIEPGKAYLLPAGLPCSYHCQGTLKKVFFDFNLFRSNHIDLLQRFGEIAVIDISPDLIPCVLTHYFGNSFADGIWIQNCIYQLLYAFHEKYTFAANPPIAYSPCVTSTMDYVQNHLSARLRVDALAERCFVSRTYLAEHFRKELGITLGRYIDQQLISFAQMQLTQTNTSIEKISIELGFCNQFYFSKCFKKHCGISPLQYRKILQHRQYGSE